MAPAKKKRTPFKANTANCKYSIVRQCLKDAGVVVDDEADAAHIVWMDTGVIQERVMELRPWQKINHFPGMSEICRKDTLARNLNRMKRLFPNEYNFFPKTWFLPTDYAALVECAKRSKSKSTCFIAKPDSSSQGRGIFLFKSPLDKHAAPLINELTTNTVVQKYLHKPFLLDGYKFDLRVYVLVTSCDPLRIHVHREGLARFATCEYQPPTTDNTDNVYMHLTNYAINKKNTNFDRTSTAGSKRTLSSIFKILHDRGFNTDSLSSRIHDAIVKTIIVAEPHLRRVYKSCSSLALLQSSLANDAAGRAECVMSGFVPHTSQCFEILGFDIMLDSKLTPYVLEVNHSPSLTCDGEVDVNVKREVLMDTLKILGMEKKKETLMGGDLCRIIEAAEKESFLMRLKKSKKKVSLEELRSEIEEKEKAFVRADDVKKEFLKKLDEWEDAKMGGFTRIYPPPLKENGEMSDTAKRYEKYLETVNKVMAFETRDTAATRGRKEVLNEMRLRHDQAIERAIAFRRANKSKPRIDTGLTAIRATMKSDTELVTKSNVPLTQEILAAECPNPSAAPSHHITFMADKKPVAKSSSCPDIGTATSTKQCDVNESMQRVKTYRRVLQAPIMQFNNDMIPIPPTYLMLTPPSQTSGHPTRHLSRYMNNSLAETKSTASSASKSVSVPGSPKTDVYSSSFLFPPMIPRTKQDSEKGVNNARHGFAQVQSPAQRQRIFQRATVDQPCVMMMPDYVNVDVGGTKSNLIDHVANLHTNETTI